MTNKYSIKRLYRKGKIRLKKSNLLRKVQNVSIERGSQPTKTTTQKRSGMLKKVKRNQSLKRPRYIQRRRSKKITVLINNFYRLRSFFLSSIILSQSQRKIIREQIRSFISLSKMKRMSIRKLTLGNEITANTIQMLKFAQSN